MKKYFLVIALLLTALLSGCTATSTPATAHHSSSVKSVAKTEKAKPKMTKSQAQAVRAADNYLDFAGFSREGLIHQLSSDAGDKFSEKDATFAVDSLDANWNKQAVRAAKAYLDYTGYSRAGLIHQLSSKYGDRFTPKQAKFAADKVGL